MSVAVRHARVTQSVSEQASPCACATVTHPAVARAGLLPVRANSVPGTLLTVTLLMMTQLVFSRKAQFRQKRLYKAP